MNDSAEAPDRYLPWHSPEFGLNPYPWFDELRRNQPVFEASEGVFVVTRYDDIVNFGRSAHITIINPVDSAFYDGFAHTMLGFEPPEHTRKRMAFSPWLTPKACKEAIKAGVIALNAELDDYIEGGVIDGHIRLGMIPTHAIICSMLQVRADDPEPLPAILAMLDVMRGASATVSEAEEAAAAAGFVYLQKCVDQLIAYKQAHPGDGLADVLIDLEARGEMPTEEMRQNLSLFWGSGAHNPSYLMGASLEFFAENPGIYRVFRAEPGRRKAILNEILRLYPAERAMVRYAVEDFEMRGVRIPKGAQIRFMLSAANRDPDAFPEPDRCLLDRPLRPGHLSFGIGHHGCAGAVLAFMETDALLAVIAERVEAIEMAGKSRFDAHDRACAYLSQAIRLKMDPNAAARGERQPE